MSSTDTLMALIDTMALVLRARRPWVLTMIDDSNRTVPRLTNSLDEPKRWSATIPPWA